VPRFKTRLVPTGIHHPRNGEFRVDKARNTRWVKQFKAMKAAGIKVPLAWGHQPKAEPADEATSKADKEYWLSKFNAGYIEDVYLDPDGTLGVIADSPGVEVNDKGEAVTTARFDDGRTVKCAIAEVSGAFRDWKDGTGKDWPDSLIHVAMTPLPVIGGQEGFTPLPESPLAKGEVRLSLATYLAADPADVAAETGTDDAGGAAGADDNPFPPKKEGEGEGGGADGKKDRLLDKMKQLSDALATEGIMVEPGDDAETYLDHMLTAINTHQATKDIHGGGGEGGGEAEVAAGEGGGAATPPQTESPPMMMSTNLSLANITDPTQKVMFKRLETVERQKRTARINALSKRRHPSTNLPIIAPAVIDRLRKSAETVQLSLSQETGEPVETELDRQLSLLEETLPSIAAGAWKDGARVVESPLTAAPDDPKATKELAKTMVARVGMDRPEMANGNGKK
jgi:hypothetical protein